MNLRKLWNEYKHTIWLVALGLVGILVVCLCGVAAGWRCY